MTKMGVALIVAVVACASASAQSRQPDVYLDILAYPITRPVTGAIEPLSSTSSTVSVRLKPGLRPAEGVRLGLVSLDKTAYDSPIS